MVGLEGQVSSSHFPANPSLARGQTALPTTQHETNSLRPRTSHEWLKCHWPTDSSSDTAPPGAIRDGSPEPSVLAHRTCCIPDHSQGQPGQQGSLLQFLVHWITRFGYSRSASLAAASRCRWGRSRFMSVSLSPSTSEPRDWD